MMLNGSDIPVHLDAPSVYHPLHEDDIVAMVPGLLGAAAAPATTVNWGGDQAVSIEEWCGYLSELTGRARPLRPHPGHHRQRPDRPDPNARAGRHHHASTGGTACAAWWPPATPSSWPTETGVADWRRLGRRLGRSGSGRCAGKAVDAPDRPRLG